MGFAILIIALPALFAALAAGVFFLIGLSIIGYAIKLFVAIKKMGGGNSDDSDYRENVNIHSPGNHLD